MKWLIQNKQTKLYASRHPPYDKNGWGWTDDPYMANDFKTRANARRLLTAGERVTKLSYPRFVVGTTVTEDGFDYDSTRIDDTKNDHYGRIIVYGTADKTRKISGRLLAKVIAGLLNGDCDE